MKYVSPVVAGIAATFVAGLVLFPVMYLVFDTFFELYVFTKRPPGAWINDMIVMITGGLWFLTASMAGGFMCLQFIDEKEDFAIFLLIVSSFIIGSVVSKGQLFALEAIPVIFIFIVGYILGGWLGIRYKKKKSRQKKIRV